MVPREVISALVIVTWLFLPSAMAQDIVVNTLAGDNDGSCDPGGTGPSDDCSLLEALDLANMDVTPVVIGFSVSGVITAEDRPTILTPVTLDGTLAPGGTRSVTIRREVPQQSFRVGVFISGANAAGAVVRGLNFTRTLLGPLGNSAGVQVEDAPDVVVGGSAADDGNHFIDTDFSVAISGLGATGATVRGNVITGNNQGEFDQAISVFDAADAMIGGTGTHDGNVISDTEFGITVGGENASGFSIIGNELASVSQEGIRAREGPTSGVIQGNTLTSAREAIDVRGVSNIVIGGLGAGEGNVITGGSTGIYIGPQSEGVSVLGNVLSNVSTFGMRTQAFTTIGTTIKGNVLTGCGFIGVGLGAAVATTFGGAGPGEGNDIADCEYAGVVLQFSFTQENWLVGNRITGASQFGIFVDGATNNLIGGTGAGEGNIIDGPATGIAIWDRDLNSIRNAILGNSVTGTAELGIDLTPEAEGDGVTANDAAPDADMGANGLQNYPEITRVEPGVELAFSLISTPGTTFRIEAFASAQADPSGHGPGARYLGFVEVTTNGSGNATGVMPATDLGKIEWATLTATAIDGASPTGFGGTSEFSRAARFSDPSLPALFKDDFEE